MNYFEEESLHISPREITTDDIITESYLVNEKDIYYNKDKFDSGEINLCFITGHSGSGKTTMGNNAQNDKTEHYEMDDLQCVKDHFTMSDLKEYGDLIYSFFSGIGKKYYVTLNELKESKTSGAEYEDKLYKDFVNYAKSYANSHKNKKYIIEGVWLFCTGENKKPYFEPSEFKDYAFYIKGTSMIISKHREAVRDSKDAQSKYKEKINYLNLFLRKNWKWYFIDEKRVNRFRDYFSALENVNESTNDINTKNWIKSKLSEEEKPMQESVIDDQLDHLRELKNKGILTNEQYKKQQDMIFKRQHDYKRNVKDEKKKEKDKNKKHHWWENLKFVPATEAVLSEEERDALPNESFGLPDERKFPLNDRTHVVQAIRMFSHCPKSKQKELRKNIHKAIRKFGMDIEFKESADYKNDWAYIMEPTSEIPRLDAYLESGKSTILRDTIYPYVETTFKSNPNSVRAFNNLVAGFINRNIDKLTTSGPVYLIPFTDKDKEMYYKLFNITETELKAAMKKHTSSLNNSDFLLLSNNPIFSLFYFVIRYFTLHPDRKSLNSALTIYALSAYPAIFSKYFKHGVNEAVMQYTIDNLTDKFLIKKVDHILGLLVTSIQHSYDFLKVSIREGVDSDVVRFIQRIRNDHNSMFKKLMNVYMDNYRNNRTVVITNNQYDEDTPIIDEVDNATTEVNNAITKVLLPIVQNGVDVTRAEAAARMAGISISDCRMFLINIINDKNIDLLQKFIESLLFLYIYEGRKTVRDVRSSYFLSWSASLFKKTNSKNPNINKINEILNIWAENSGVYAKFKREASRINYKKAIFFYVVLSIQKYIG